MQAMATMKSDYDQRQALDALLQATAPASTATRCAAAVDHMKSSYDKRMVLDGCDRPRRR